MFLLKDLTAKVVYERPEKPLEFVVSELEALKRKASSWYDLNRSCFCQLASYLHRTFICVSFKRADAQYKSELKSQEEISRCRSTYITLPLFCLLLLLTFLPPYVRSPERILPSHLLCSAQGALLGYICHFHFLSSTVQPLPFWAPPRSCSHHQPPYPLPNAVVVVLIEGNLDNCNNNTLFGYRCIYWETSSYDVCIERWTIHRLF